THHAAENVGCHDARQRCLGNYFTGDEPCTTDHRCDKCDQQRVDARIHQLREAEGESGRHDDPGDLGAGGETSVPDRAEQTAETDCGEQVAVAVGAHVEALLRIEHELNCLRAVRELCHRHDEHQGED